MPAHCRHVWDWFWRLSRRRRTGPEALSYSDIGEWQRLSGTAIRPCEVDMLMRMDDAYLAETRKEQAAAMAQQIEQSKKG